MYEAHYGLRARPFGETTCPSQGVPLPSRDAALRRLRYGLDQGQGPALLFGPPGVGKTLTARILARDLDAPAVHLTYPALPAPELMAFLADELAADGSPGRGAGLGSSIRRLRAALADAAERGRRPLLIVDEAHLIDDPAAFEALRLLLNFATAGPPDLRLLLVGGPEVLLHLPFGLADRLTARCLLGPLAAEESAAYVRGRLAAAGADGPLFDDPALAALHRYADGLPRRLNRLADLALLIAYARELDRADEQAVALAARECQLDDASLAA